MSDGGQRGVLRKPEPFIGCRVEDVCMDLEPSGANVKEKEVNRIEH